MGPITLPLHHDRFNRIARNIGLALLFGIIAGVCFGQSCLWIVSPIGKGFLMLLKMLILPYMAISLIHGIGNLYPAQAKALLLRSLYFLLASSVITYLIVYSTAFFFSNIHSPPLPIKASQQPPPVVQFLNLFIPDNLLRAFTTENIPAIVMISILLGIALMQMEKKHTLLPQLDGLLELFGGVMRMIAYTFPLGIFALSAELAGTITLADLLKLRLYLLAYFSGTLLLSFWVFPRLLYHLTGIPYGIYFRMTRDTLIISWLTGNLLIAIPYMIANVQDLLRYRSNLEGAEKTREETNLNLPETLVPIFYSFPSAGNLFSLLFIFFSSFYYAQPLDLWDQISLFLLGFPAVSGATSVVLQANAFLLDFLQLPIDAHSLFAAIMPFTRGMQVLLSTVGITTLTLAVIAATPSRLLRLPLRLVQDGTLSLLFLSPLFIAAHFFVIPPSDPIEAYEYLSLNIPSSSVPTSNVLKVSYRSMLPYVFKDTNMSLAGMEVNLLAVWAQATNKRLEWNCLPVGAFHSPSGKSQEASADILIGGLPYHTGSALHPVVYHFDAVCFLVKDHLRRKFSLLENLSSPSEKLQVISFDHTTLPLGHQLRSHLNINFADSGQFQLPASDTPILWTLSAARAWTRYHPSYIAIQPYPHLGLQPIAIYCASSQIQTELAQWLNLQKATGGLEQLVQPWINPKDPPKPPRWAFFKDVIPLLN